MMRKNQACNYNGANWLYIRKDSQGIHLMSTDRHVDDIVVPHKYEKYIREGFKK